MNKVNRMNRVNKVNRMNKRDYTMTNATKLKTKDGYQVDLATPNNNCYIKIFENDKFTNFLNDFGHDRKKVINLQRIMINELKRQLKTNLNIINVWRHEITEAESFFNEMALTQPDKSGQIPQSPEYLLDYDKSLSLESVAIDNDKAIKLLTDWHCYNPRVNEATFKTIEFTNAAKLPHVCKFEELPIDKLAVGETLIVGLAQYIPQGVIFHLAPNCRVIEIYAVLQELGYDENDKKLTRFISGRQAKPHWVKEVMVSEMLIPQVYHYKNNNLIELPYLII